MSFLLTTSEYFSLLMPCTVQYNTRLDRAARNTRKRKDTCRSREKIMRPLGVLPDLEGKKCLKLFRVLYFFDESKAHSILNEL